jgi:hypothetical protein
MSGKYRGRESASHSSLPLQSVSFASSRATDGDGRSLPSRKLGVRTDGRDANATAAENKSW